MAKDNKSPIVTKKHLARVERERRQTRTIVIVSAIVIGLAVILIGWGTIQNYVIKPRQPVVTVDGTEVSTGRFQALAHYNAAQLVQQYSQYYQFMQYFGSDQSTQSTFIQTLSQISYELEPEYLGQNTIDSLIEYELVRKEAASRGITVTTDEINASMEEFLGYYPAGTPTSAPTEAAQPTSTLSALQLTLVPPTPTTAPTAIPTEQLTGTTPTAAPTTGPTATTEVVPTPTEYTVKLYNDNMKSYLNYAEVSEDDLRWIIESQLLQQKLIDVLTADVSKEADQVWVRQIIVADEATAKQVIDRLAAGEDFAALAAELSTDEATKATGGDLGWASAGTLDPALDAFLFSAEIGQVSDPIQLTAGWYIVQLLGHEVRPISSSEYQSLVSSTYNDWLTKVKDAAKITTIKDWLELTPTSPSIPANMSLTQN